jgi:hypothetical protein
MDKNIIKEDIDDNEKKDALIIGGAGLGVASGYHIANSKIRHDAQMAEISRTGSATPVDIDALKAANATEEEIKAAQTRNDAISAINKGNLQNVGVGVTGLVAGAAAAAKGIHDRIADSYKYPLAIANTLVEAYYGGYLAKACENLKPLCVANNNARMLVSEAVDIFSTIANSKELNESVENKRVVEVANSILAELYK